MVVRIAVLSYVYPNHILQSLKLSPKIQIFFLTKRVSDKSLINIATNHSGPADSKAFRDPYRKFTKDDNLMLIDVAAALSFIKNLGLE